MTLFHKFLILLLPLALGGCGDRSAGGTSLKLQHSDSISLPAEGKKIPAPRSVTAAPGGELVILDDCGNVTVMLADGAVKKRWKMPDCTLGRPEGVCVLKDGRIAVGDTHYSRVVVFSPDGSISTIFGDKGSGPGQFGNPVGVTQDPSGNIYVSEYGETNRIQKFSPEFGFLKAFGETGTGPGQLQRAAGIAWRDGKIFAADAVNNRIQVFSDSGEFIRSIGGDDASFQLYLPYDLCFQGEDIVVVEYGGGRISRFSRDGAYLGSFGKPGRNIGQFTTPWGVAADAQGKIFVADTGNRRIAILK